MENYTLLNVSIGLDVSKETISVFIPINKLDFEIQNVVTETRRILMMLDCFLML